MGIQGTIQMHNEWRFLFKWMTQEKQWLNNLSEGGNWNGSRVGKAGDVDERRQFKTNRTVWIRCIIDKKCE